MLAFKGDFDVIQAVGVLSGAAQQRREGHQIGDIFPLAGLGIKMQQSRRLNIEKLQDACSFHAITPSSMLSSRPYI